MARRRSSARRPSGRGDNRERLWRRLIDGAIDLIATDHSPAPPGAETPRRRRLRARVGRHRLAAARTCRLCGPVPPSGAFRSSAWRNGWPNDPATLAGLATKGAIAVGRDADLVVWDPDEETIVDARSLQHRHPITPYDGRRLRGGVVTTILRGQTVFDRGEFVSSPMGVALRRPASSA